MSSTITLGLSDSNTGCFRLSIPRQLPHRSAKVGVGVGERLKLRVQVRVLRVRGYGKTLPHCHGT